MIVKLRQLVLLWMLLLINTQVLSQILVNKSWEHVTGLPADSFKLNISTIDPLGNLIVLANNYTSGEKANILISKYHNQGQLLWQKEFNSLSNDIDFGTAISTNTFGDIFITGGTFHKGNGNFDYITLRINQNDGSVIWKSQYNGPGNGKDIPTGLVADDNGVSVTGQSWGKSTGFDYLTLQYDLLGNQVWISRYDYSNGNDIPVGIQKKTNGDVVVIGGSDNKIYGQNFAALIYNANGAQIGVQRGNPNSLGFYHPSAITQDEMGNIYVTGKATKNGSNFDIKTIKINTGFLIEWETLFDGSGLEDGSTDIDTDSLGNIYVCGHTEKLNGGRDFITIKYDKAGVELWAKKRSADVLIHEAKATSIVVEDDGVCYVTGSVFNGNNNDMLTIRYESNGSTSWEKQHDGKDHGGDMSYIIERDKDGSIYISGTTEHDGDIKNITIKYAQFDRNIDVEFDEMGKPTHVQNEILIRFDGSVIDTTLVDNMNLQFGKVREFIAPDVISLIDKQINTEGQLENWWMSKVFKQLTTKQKYLVNKIGDTIPMPDFWATFILYIPKGIVHLKDEISISKMLDDEDLKPSIWFAEPNYTGKWLNVPSDSLYLKKQHSLHATLIYPNGHINVEGAWDIETGSDLVAVGVYDSGIDYTHEDFIDPAGKSVVRSGHDWLNNIAINTNNLNPQFKPDSNGHGTGVAGIIGALRNNNIGIAGIAGGDVDGLGNAGVDLISNKIGNESPGSLDIILDAIQHGTSLSSPIDIMNHSWVINSMSFSLREVIHFAAQMLIVNVAAIGNDGTNSLYYPASYNDDWVIDVGASGSDGEYKDQTNGNQSKPKDLYSFNYGGNIDLIAPGTRLLVKSLATNGLDYGNYGGTSVAAPHVTGVSALLLSHAARHSLNLTPEDVEQLLQLGAKDKWDLGYDTLTGWGLLDAAASLRLIEYPQYTLYQEKTTSSGANYSLFANNIPLLLAEKFKGLSAGVYFVDVYKISVSSSHSLQTNQVILNAWVRNNSSDPWGFSNPLYPSENITLDGYSNTHANLSGYVYFFKHKMVGNILKPINEWLPYNVNHNFRLAYSLHVYDSTATTIEPLVPDMDAVFPVSVYPNPATEWFNVSYSLSQNDLTSITIFDIKGLVTHEIWKGYQYSGNHHLKVDIKNWPEGIYICQVKTSAITSQKKIIKINDK